MSDTADASILITSQLLCEQDCDRLKKCLPASLIQAALTTEPLLHCSKVLLQTCAQNAVMAEEEERKETEKDERYTGGREGKPHFVFI